MPRHATRYWFALGLACLTVGLGCADEGVGGDDDTTTASADAGVSAPGDGDAGDDAAAPEPEVWCGDDMTCSGDVLGTCCFKLDAATFMLATRCVYDPGACAQDESYLSCDERADCPGTPCCMVTLTIDGNDRYMATCGDDPMGCGLAEELCQGDGAPGACTQDRYCCHPADDDFGTCVIDQAACETMQMEP